MSLIMFKKAFVSCKDLSIIVFEVSPAPVAELIISGIFAFASTSITCPFEVLANASH